MKQRDTRSKSKWTVVIIVFLALLGGGAWTVWKMENQLESSNGLLTSPGVFASPNGRFTLEVKVDPQHIVQYAVRMTGANEPIIHANAGSTYQRWYFAWDRNGNLWIHSSDIGTSLFVFEQDSARKVDLQPGIPELSDMPATFRQQLPEGVRKRLGVANR